MTLMSVKKGCLAAMQKEFPTDKYRYYSTDVAENFIRPCFFTQLKVISAEPMNFISRLMIGSFYINFFQKETDEAEILKVADKLMDCFEVSVPCGDRYAKTMDFSWDFVGTGQNALEVVVDLRWTQKNKKNEEYPLIKEVEVSKEMEE